jgi:hypothetical protein
MTRACVGSAEVWDDWSVWQMAPKEITSKTFFIQVLLLENI